MIPTEIGSLTNLTYLRLSYNAFDHEAPNELADLTQLELVQLHGNRLSGTIPEWIVVPKNDSDFVSSFIADCGSPSIFEVSQ